MHKNWCNYLHWTIPQNLSSTQEEGDSISIHQESKVAHERYVQAYEWHRKLKQQIWKVEFENQFNQDKQEWKALDDHQLQALDKLRVSCMVAAKTEHPDLDFGSLDEEYADIQEPQIQFNPDTDDLPALAEWSNESDAIFQETEEVTITESDWLERIKLLLDVYDSTLGIPDT